MDAQRGRLACLSLGFHASVSNRVPQVGEQPPWCSGYIRGTESSHIGAHIRRAATLVLARLRSRKAASICKAIASHLLVVLCGRLFGLRTGKLTKRMLTKPGGFYHHQLQSSLDK